MKNFNVKNVQKAVAAVAGVCSMVETGFKLINDLVKPVDDDGRYDYEKRRYDFDISFKKEATNLPSKVALFFERKFDKEKYFIDDEAFGSIKFIKPKKKKQTNKYVINSVKYPVSIAKIGRFFTENGWASKNYDGEEGEELVLYNYKLRMPIESIRFYDVDEQKNVLNYNGKKYDIIIVLEDSTVLLLGKKSYIVVSAYSGISKCKFDPDKSIITFEGESFSEETEEYNL